MLMGKWQAQSKAGDLGQYSRQFLVITTAAKPTIKGIMAKVTGPTSLTGGKQQKKEEQQSCNLQKKYSRCSVTQSCLTLSTPDVPVLHNLLELAQTHVRWVSGHVSSSHLVLCHLPLLLPSVFPSNRVISSESALFIRWPKYRSFSFSISSSNEYLGLISFRIDWFDLLAVPWTLKSLLQHYQKHQFFSAQPSSWSNSHMRTLLMEEP